MNAIPKPGEPEVADERRSKPAFIKRLRLRNFKSVAFCDVTLQPITLLVGPHGVGKGNVLDALRFLADMARFGIAEALACRGGFDAIACRTNGAEHFSIGVECEGAAWYEIRVSREGEHREELISGDRERLIEQFGRMRFYRINPDAMRAGCGPTPGQFLESDGRNWLTVLAEAERGEEWRYRRIVGGPNAVDRSVELLGVREVEGRPSARFRVDPNDSYRPEFQGRPILEFGPEAMGDGVLRACGVALALDQTVPILGGPSLVAFEEPEAGLNRDAAEVVFELFEGTSSRVQVVVTTHGPDLLDSENVLPEEVRGVMLEGGETRIGPIDRVCYKILDQGYFSLGDLARDKRLSPDADDQDRQNELSRRSAGGDR